MATDLKAGLWTYLQSQTALTDLIGTRLWPGVAASTSTYPYVVFDRISSDHGHTTAGSDGAVVGGYRFTVFDNDSVGAEAVIEQLRLELDGYIGAMGSVTCMVSLLRGVADSWRPDRSGSEPGVYTAAVDFDIVHRVDKPTF